MYSSYQDNKIINSTARSDGSADIWFRSGWLLCTSKLTSLCFFAYTVLFLTLSSLWDLVFDERALPWDRVSLPKIIRFSSHPCGQEQAPSTHGGEVDGRGRTHPSHPKGFFSASSKTPFLKTSSWETTAAASIVLMCICQSKQEWRKG